MSQEQILTPVGRFVQGNMFEPNTTNMKGRPLLTKGGEPRSEIFFAIAIEKTNPEWDALWAHIYGVGQASFPGGEYAQAGFSWKYIDGDLPAHVAKPGFAGCHVLRCSTGLIPLKCVSVGGATMLTDPASIKRGYYIRTNLTVKGNGQTGEDAGVYLNPTFVEMIAYGEEIMGGPDPKEVLSKATAAANIPAGASATPLATSAPPAAGTPPPPAAGTPPPPAAGTPPPPAAGTPPPPAAGTPPPPAAGTPPPPAPEPVETMTPKAAGKTLESFIAIGWTKEQLVAEGYMVAPAAGFSQ